MLNAESVGFWKSLTHNTHTHTHITQAYYIYNKVAGILYIHSILAQQNSPKKDLWERSVINV
jgi:hypothetical protein